MTVLREGDIYAWEWKPELERNDFGAFGDYHCKSRVAIVHGGKLLDTYWMNFGSSFLSAGWAEMRTGAHSIGESSVDISLIANLADLEEIRHGEEVYYRREDIVDLRHANCSKAPIYRRRGSERNVDVMLDLLEGKVCRARSDIYHAERTIERLEAARRRILEGEINVQIY